jgi:rod shape-determining protein MreD
MSAVVGRLDSVHTPRVVTACVIAVVAAFLLQTAVLPAVGSSAAVPVVFATLCLLGIVFGVRTGAIVGFLAGLLLDLTNAGTLGVGALLGCLLGAAAGSIRVDRWRWSGLASAWVLTSLAAVAFAVVNGFLAGLPLRGSWAWVWILAGALVSLVVLLPARGWLQAVVR